MRDRSVMIASSSADAQPQVAPAVELVDGAANRALRQVDVVLQHAPAHPRSRRRRRFRSSSRSRWPAPGWRSRSPPRAPASLPADWSCRSRGRPSCGTDATRRGSRTAVLPCRRRCRRRAPWRRLAPRRPARCDRSRAERIGEADVRDDTVAEERARPLRRAVDELIRHDEVAGRDLLAQTADRADRDDPLDAELLQGKDVGAKVDLGRQPAMAAAVARQEDQFACRRAGRERARRTARRTASRRRTSRDVARDPAISYSPLPPMTPMIGAAIGVRRASAAMLHAAPRPRQLRLEAARRRLECRRRAAGAH